MKVYLAGPIKGCNYAECTDWREHAIKSLQPFGIIGISPMRAKEFLKNEKKIDDLPYDHLLAGDRGIITRDHFDVMTCDFMLANLLEVDKASIGTMIEYGWAYSYRKPVITVIENQGNPHDHPMIREITGYRVETLESGLEIAKAFFHR